MNNRNISPQQAHDWLTTGEAILIDVREPDEFKAEHIAHAASLPLGHVGNAFAQLGIAPSRKVIFQCLRGARGNQACALVGETKCDAYNIEGGIEAWKNAGLPVVTSGASKVSVFRQVQMIVGSLVLLATLLGLSGQTWAFYLAAFLGAALAVAGLSGWCGLAMLLAKAPWNKG